jgi:hypothetical protein
MKGYLFFCIIFLFCRGMLAGQVYPADSSRGECIERASLLLDEAVAIMQKNYYKKDSVQWEQLITKEKASLTQSTGCEDAYKAVQSFIDKLKEKHSFIMPPLKAAVYNGNINSSQPGASNKKLTGDITHGLIEGNIAYINVPWIATTDQKLCRLFADSIQSVIKTFDQKGISRWIVDLRKNTGGNCWPMLAGLGPLLGNGIHGFFVSPKQYIPIRYENGIVMQGKQPRCSVNNPYTMITANKTILVLTGENTASAGEIVALAFKGLDNVFLYGEPTAGLTTANASYSLSDGSMLVLTVCKEADRNKKIIEGKIHPDELIKKSPGNNSDDIMTSAVMYLQML